MYVCMYASNMFYFVVGFSTRIYLISLRCFVLVVTQGGGCTKQIYFLESLQSSLHLRERIHFILKTYFENIDEHWITNKSVSKNIIIVHIHSSYTYANIQRYNIIAVFFLNLDINRIKTLHMSSNRSKTLPYYPYIFLIQISIQV